MFANTNPKMLNNHTNPSPIQNSLSSFGGEDRAEEKPRVPAPPPPTASFVSFRVFRGFSTAALRISAFCFLLLAFLCVGCTKEMRKNRYLARANTDFQSGQYDMAEVEYLKVLQVAPRNPVAFARLGSIYYDQGRLLRAVFFLQKAVELDPENGDLGLKLCLARFSSGHFKEAREDAQKILKKQPGQEEALIMLAETAFGQKELQDTRQQIESMRQGDKDRAGYHLARGAILLKLGQQTNVASELKKALELEPKSPAALAALGNLYWMQGDLQKAEQALKSAAELSPLRSFRKLRYAEFKLQNGSPGEAKQLFEEMTRKAPDYLPAWLSLAQLAFDEGKFEDCAAVTQKILARAPESYEGMLLDGKLKLARGEGPQAVAEFTRMTALGLGYERFPQVQYHLALGYLLAGDVPKSTAHLNQALSLNPNYTDAIVLLAELNLRKGDAAPAITSLTQLLKQQPLIPQAQFLLAAAYAAQKNLDEAAAVYRRMLLLFPKNPRVPFLLAKVLVQQNKLDEVRKFCEKAMEISPDYLAPLQMLVDLDLFGKKPDPEAALALVNQQIARRPSDPDLESALARIYLHQGEAARGEAALLKAIELAPNYKTPYQELAQFYFDSKKPQQALEKLAIFAAKTNDVMVLMQIGMIQDKLKNYPAARDTYEKLLTLDPKFSPALNNLAYTYSEHLGQVDKAIEIAERARQLLPNDPGTEDTLGWILFRKTDFPKALPLLEEAASKLPTEPEVQFHLGMVRYALGQEAPARLALEVAVPSNTEFSGKEEAQRCLAILALDPKTADAAARALLEKRAADAPDDSVALGRLAAVYDRDGAFDKAVKAFEQVLKQNPKNASALARLSEIYAGPLKNPQKALEFAKEAHAAAPEDARISQMLGHLAVQTGDYMRAATLLQEAARKLPDQPALLYDLAWACYGLGRLPEAETAMQKALKVGITNHQADAQRFLAMTAAYRDAAQRKRVASEVEQVLRADPNYIPALMVSGLLRQENGNYQQARQAYEQVLACNKLFVPAMRDLAILCSQHFPDDSKAFDLALKARESFPDDPNLAKAFGILAFRRGDYSRAVQLLKESSQKLNNDAETLYYLGMAQYRLKRPEESKQTLQKALALNLSPQLAEQAKRVLAELGKPPPKQP
jgi:tetratricopeptide (TPR) repeat protein